MSLEPQPRWSLQRPPRTRSAAFDTLTLAFAPDPPSRWMFSDEREGVRGRGDRSGHCTREP